LRHPRFAVTNNPPQGYLRMSFKYKELPPSPRSDSPHPLRTVTTCLPMRDRMQFEGNLKPDARCPCPLFPRKYVTLSSPLHFHSLKSLWTSPAFPQLFDPKTRQVNTWTVLMQDCEIQDQHPRPNARGAIIPTLVY